MLNRAISMESILASCWPHLSQDIAASMGFDLKHVALAAASFPIDLMERDMKGGNCGHCPAESAWSQTARKHMIDGIKS
jgi:hypothetical protein